MISCFPLLRDLGLFWGDCGGELKGGLWGGDEEGWVDEGIVGLAGIPGLMRNSSSTLIEQKSLRHTHA